MDAAAGKNEMQDPKEQQTVKNDEEIVRDVLLLHGTRLLNLLQEEVRRTKHPKSLPRSRSAYGMVP
jgi:hypothetical protein